MLRMVTVLVMVSPALTGSGLLALLSARSALGGTTSKLALMLSLPGFGSVTLAAMLALALMVSAPLGVLALTVATKLWLPEALMASATQLMVLPLWLHPAGTETMVKLAGTVVLMLDPAGTSMGP